jgi:hypothetical protein
MNRRFSVRIHYCEPTYDEHVGRALRIFAWEALYFAASHSEAHQRAVERFLHLAAASMVSWRRDIVEVVVAELGTRRLIPMLP